jgi:hypothetical protein
MARYRMVAEINVWTCESYSLQIWAERTKDVTRPSRRTQGLYIFMKEPPQTGYIR